MRAVPAPWQRWQPPRYSLAAASGDAAGGLVAALIALPYGLAMASLMGLPPMLGLLTSLITSPVTALLGRNAMLIGGTSTVTVPFIAAAVAVHGPSGAAKITIAAAVLMLVFCVLRLGAWIARVPQPVVSGFSCGIGAMMIISQLKPLLGLPIASGGAMPLQLARAIESLPRLNPQIAAIGLTTVAAAPGPMIGIAAAALAGWLFGWHDKEVGALSLQLPPLAGFTWHPADVVEMLPNALGLAVVSSVNLLITSRVVDHFRGRHWKQKPSDADRELGAYGIANLLAGLFGAPFSVGIPARSLASVRCGGSTRMANILHAACIALLLTAAAPTVAHIPIAALAGVTAWMGFCLLEWSTWSRLHKMRRTDAAAFFLTALVTISWNAALGVALGCAAYTVRWLLQFLRQNAPTAAPPPDPAHTPSAS
jgi:sulfate permease, SulP family